MSARARALRHFGRRIPAWWRAPNLDHTTTRQVLANAAKQLRHRNEPANADGSTECREQLDDALEHQDRGTG